VGKCYSDPKGVDSTKDTATEGCFFLRSQQSHIHTSGLLTYRHTYCLNTVRIPTKTMQQCVIIDIVNSRVRLTGFYLFCFACQLAPLRKVARIGNIFYLLLLPLPYQPTWPQEALANIRTVTHSAYGGGGEGGQSASPYISSMD
jgi:hypothetical protein